MGRPIDLQKRELVSRMYITEVLTKGERGAATRVAKALGITLTNACYHLRQDPNYQKLHKPPTDARQIWVTWKKELTRGSYGAQQRTARRLALHPATVSVILRQEPAYERLLDEAPRFDPSRGESGSRVAKERIRAVWRSHVKGEAGLYKATRATMDDLGVSKNQATNATRGIWVPLFRSTGQDSYIISVPGPRPYGKKPLAVRCSHEQGYGKAWVWVNTYPDGGGSRHDNRREARDEIARRYL